VSTETRLTTKNNICSGLIVNSVFHLHLFWKRIYLPPSLPLHSFGIHGVIQNLSLICSTVPMYT